MKKWVGMLLSLVMVLCMMTTSFAATAAEQVVVSGATWYYNEEGQRVENATFPGNAAVKLSKTVKPTGNENEFEVELQVSTTENILELHSNTPDAAVLLILDVSNSMDDCDVCGKEYSDHSNWEKGHYVSRLAKAKAAAVKFLQDFAATKEETDDKRWVAIVDFGSTAYRRQAWVDVATEAGLTQAVAVINSLTVAHSDLNNVSDDGGTNIEGALMLGANVWENKNNQMDTTTAAAIKALDYKYTILLTDGQPTYHVEGTKNSTSQIGGSKGGGSYTTVADAKDVGTQADRIKALGSLSKLYSICYGSVTNNGSTTYVANDKPFSNWDREDRNSVYPKVTSKDMTILEWLDAFSTEAYNGAAQGDYDLFDTFNSIISQIQLATQAWKVDDPMGAHVVWGGEVQQSHDNKSSFDTQTNTLHWDVLASDYSGFVNDETNPVLTYTYKYKITLDNLDTSYEAGTSANTNNNATLTYAVKQDDGMWNRVDPVSFPEPAVKGFAGTLTFTKGWLEDEVFKTLEGVKFTLTSKDKSAEGVHWTQTVESGANGTVTFTGIPSGHDYTLTESNLTIDGKHFANPGSMDVSVNWGETTFSKLNNQNQLINQLAQKEVDLTLVKVFGNNNKPESIDFTVVLEGTNKTYNVTLSNENNWTVTLDGLTPGNYIITEDAAWEGYDLTKTVTWNGGSSLSFGQYGNVHVPLEVEGENSTAEYTVTFTNTYTQQVGTVSVAKTFWEHDHDQLVSGGSGDVEFEEMPESLYQDISVEITLTDTKGKTHSVTLNKVNGWSASFGDLPVGEYTIAENRENLEAIQIEDHDFIHLHVTLDGEPIENGKITVGKGKEIELALQNHYTHHVGDIRVEKLIKDSAGNDISVPENTKFYVDVYNAPYTEGATAVATIMVEKLVSGEWVGTSKDLLVGDYYLKERTTNINGYDFVSGVFDVGNTVTVRKGETTSTTTVALTNTYEKQIGKLTVMKEFVLPAGVENFDYPDSIRINVLDGSASGDVVTTLELKASNTPAWTATVDLPLGSYYLSEVMAEGVPGSADVENYGVTASWDNASVTITNGANVTSKVTNTYTKDFGTLTISKEFEGAPDQAATVTFVVYQKNADGSRGDVVESIVLPDINGKWNKSVHLPVGDYLLFEYGAHNAFQNYILKKVTFNGNVWYEPPTAFTAVQGFPVTVTKDTTVNLAAENTYEQDVANITVTKAFAGDLNADTFDGSIDVLVYSGNSVVEKLTLNKDNSWTATAEKLPAGQEYTLVEVVRSLKSTEPDAELNTAYRDGFDLVHTWNGDNEFILEKNQNVELTVTNTYTRKTGELILHKIFTGVDTSDVALLDAQEVTVHIKQGGQIVETVTLNKAGGWDESVTLDVGTYTLEEAAISLNGYNHKDAAFASVSGQVTDAGADAKTATVKIEGDQTAAVTVVVTNVMERKTGSLTITKAFDKDSDLKAANFAGKKINILVKHEGALYQTVTLPTEMGAWSVTLENVPTGAYTVEEVTGETEANTAHVNGYGLHVGYTNHGNVNIIQGTTPVEMVVTNKYTQDVGYIRVHKVFADNQASKDAETFIPDTGIAIQVYDMDGNLEATGYVSRKNDGWVTFGPLPVDTYKLLEVVGEDEPGTAHVEDYALSVTWKDSDTVTVTTGHTETAPLMATVTNDYSHTKGTLTISKVFAGCADITKPEIIVHVKQGENNVQTVKLNSGNNWSVTLHDMPVGEYTVVEDEATAAIINHSLAVTYSATKVTVAGEISATVTITNTYTHDTGSLTISKVFDKESVLGEGYFADKKISFLVKRNGAEYQTVTLPVVGTDGNKVWSVTLENVLAGDYTVEEVESTAHVENYGLTVSYNGAATGNVIVTKGDVPAVMTVSNKYTEHVGSLTISKAFAEGSDLKADYFAERPINILVKYPGAADQRITLPTADGKWSVELKDLPVGTYTVEEVISPEETNTAYVSGYGLNVTYSDAANTGKVVVRNAATATMTVTNSYTDQAGELTIKKVFADGSALGANSFSVIDVDILHKDGTLFQQIVLEAAKNWTWTGTLPVDEYIVREVTEPGEPGSAYRAEYHLSVEYSDEAKTGNVSVIGAKPAEIFITNKYTYAPTTGSLMIKKEFKGAQYLYPASVEFTITGNGFSHKVTVSELNNWTAYIGGLYAGEYTVTEALVDGADYDLTTTWSSEGGKIFVFPGQTATITCTNAYYPKETVSFRIPVEKTVHAAGAKAPEGPMAFTFGTSWQGSNGVIVRFENDPANNLGNIQQSSANTYTAILHGAGAVKGYIVIEGYAEQLAGFKLQTWENLTGYADEAAAAAAGWTFDKTATDGTVNWNIEIGVGQTGLDASIVRTDSGIASKVSFDNVYISPIDVPETGDGENLGLWAILCGISALGVFLLVFDHKRKVCMTGK